jgi:16S rRNA processing protein RimM
VSESASALITVGKIQKPHGVRGEVNVFVLTEFPELRYAPGVTLLLTDGRTLTIESVRAHHGKRLVQFEGVTGRDEADRLRGELLWIAEQDLAELPEGRWWPHQLEGLAMVTDTGRSLGRLTEIISTPANDVWAATDEHGVETLIPVIDDVLLAVDIPGGVITVRETPGLTTPE